MRKLSGILEEIVNGLKHSKDAYQRKVVVGDKVVVIFEWHNDNSKEARIGDVLVVKDTDDKLISCYNLSSGDMCVVDSDRVVKIKL